jgi:hypothetical protein
MSYRNKIKAATVDDLTDFASESGIKVGIEFNKLWKEYWNKLQVKLDKETFSDDERASVLNAFVEAIHGHFELTEMGMRKELITK